MKRTFLLGAFVLALGACDSAASEPGYQAGALGNGGFVFSCDDAVSCTPYSGDASKFPKAVSLGSTFAVSFIPKDADIGIHFNDSESNRGITIMPVSDFVTVGPSGLTAVKAGYATITSRDASGQLIDYTVLQVAKPDSLVVYDGDDPSATQPTLLTTVTLATSATKSLRAFAQRDKQDLAGSLQTEWVSSDTSIVEVQSTTDGKATIVALKGGNATLTVTGGTFVQSVPVQVTP